MTAYVDADIILYRCLSATATEPYYKQIRAVDTTIDSVLSRVSPDDYEIVCSGTGNFRYEIYPEYKANRKDKPKPTYLYDAKLWLGRYWNATMTDGIEADDHIASAARENDVVASTDKDFRQLDDIRIYDFVKDVTHTVTNGMKFFLLQMMIGDRADNIPGLKNPAKAHHKVPPNFTYETAVIALEGKDLVESLAYIRELYNDEERFDTIARLLWLRRGPNDEYHYHLPQ